MPTIGNATARKPAPPVGTIPIETRPRPGGVFFGPRMRYPAGAVMMPRHFGKLIMNSIAMTLRPADILLDRVLNPADDADLNQWQPKHLVEACGIIPDFFVTACITAEQENPDTLTLQHIADGMDRAYQFGGFGYPWPGSLDADGVYRSQYDEDPPMSPLVRFSFNSGARVFECFVYECAITAIRERGTASLFIGRFD